MRKPGRYHNWSKENAKNRYIYRSRILNDYVNGGKTGKGVWEESIKSLPDKTEFACLWIIIMFALL